MAVRTITKLGNPVLRTVASEVDTKQCTSEKVHSLVRDMVDTMINARGIGIAAPQVGVSLQIAVINGDAGPFAIINPRVLKQSRETTMAEEGCLSIPGVFATVRRAHSVTVEYLNEQGMRQSTEASGLLARVFQHEIDHLNGILFIDKAESITKGALP